jgi:hypothetical protein
LECGLSQKIEIERVAQTVKLPKETWRRLRLYCADKGVKQQTAMEQAIEAFVTKKCGDKYDSL